MKVSKFFDWPRKVKYGSYQGGGDVAFIETDPVTTTPSVNASISFLSNIYFRSSGRPVQISFESVNGIYPSGEVTVTSGLSVNEFYFNFRVKRNGNQIKYERVSTFYPQGSTAITASVNKMSQFNFIDLTAPAGENRYEFDIITYTPYTYAIQPTRIILMEL